MGKVACVTGSTSGIGLAIAKSLAQAGYKLAVVGTRPEADAKHALQEIGAAQSFYIRADIGSSSGRSGIIEGISEHFGRLDVLVNNAGVGPKARIDILETSEESYDKVLSTNLKGPFFLTQLAARYMIDLLERKIIEKPKIVNISSISEYTSSVNRPEYCISKAGIGMITKLFADRLAEYGILVYEIRPGIIRTPMTGSVQSKYDKMIFEDDLLPIARWGRPEDVAAAVAAVCSGAFEYSTGMVLDVDGGFHMHRL